MLMGIQAITTFSSEGSLSWNKRNLPEPNLSLSCCHTTYVAGSEDCRHITALQTATGYVGRSHSTLGQFHSLLSPWALAWTIQCKGQVSYAAHISGDASLWQSQQQVPQDFTKIWQWHLCRVTAIGKKPSSIAEEEGNPSPPGKVASC